MTTKRKIPNVEDVKKIVINRISVWKYDDEIDMWYKINGGPGFKINSKSHEKNSYQMQSLVAGKLYRTHNVKVFENKNTVVFEDKIAYRYWISEGTLNIIRRDLV